MFLINRLHSSYDCICHGLQPDFLRFPVTYLLCVSDLLRERQGRISPIAPSDCLARYRIFRKVEQVKSGGRGDLYELLLEQMKQITHSRATYTHWFPKSTVEPLVTKLMSEWWDMIFCHFLVTVKNRPGTLILSFLTACTVRYGEAGMWICKSHQKGMFLYTTVLKQSRFPTGFGCTALVDPEGIVSDIVFFLLRLRGYFLLHISPLMDGTSTGLTYLLFIDLDKMNHSW